MKFTPRFDAARWSTSASRRKSSGEAPGATSEIGVTEIRLFTIGMPYSASISSATGTSFAAVLVSLS